MIMQGDLAILDAASDARAAFETSFAEEISAALGGVLVVDIIVSEVLDDASSGRRRRQLQEVELAVSFRVATENATTANGLVEELFTQGADPDSALRSSDTLASTTAGSVTAAVVVEDAEDLSEVQWAEDMYDNVVANSCQVSGSCSPSFALNASHLISAPCPRFLLEPCQGVLVYIAIAYVQPVDWSLTHFELQTVSASGSTEPNTHNTDGERFCVPIGTYVMQIGGSDDGTCCTGRFTITPVDSPTAVASGTDFDSTSQSVFGLGVSYNATRISTVGGCTCQLLFVHGGQLHGSDGRCAAHAHMAGLSWCKTDATCGLSGCDEGNGVFGCGDFYFDYCIGEALFLHVTANEGPVGGNVVSGGGQEFFVFDAQGGCESFEPHSYYFTSSSATKMTRHVLPEFLPLRLLLFLTSLPHLRRSYTHPPCAKVHLRPCHLARYTS